MNAPDERCGAAPHGNEVNEELGGDAACWAHRVCPACGRLNDAERPTICQDCGASFAE